MTFSVDVDFSPFQAGPPQDATARRSAGEGRGKDFAGSLFGVAQDTATPPENWPLAGNAHAAFSLLNFPHTPPSPENLLLSSTASATVFPALMTEGEAVDLEAPALPASGNTDVPAAITGEALTRSPELPGSTREMVDTDLSGEATGTLAVGSEPTDAAQAESETMAAETPEDTGTSPAPANPPALVETPAAVLPMALVAPNPANAAVRVPVDQAAALAGVPSGNKTAPQTMAEPAALNRRSDPASAEPPTHADLTAELVSNQADSALPEMLPVSSDPGLGGDATTGSAQSSPALSGTLGGTLSQTAASSQPSGAPATPQLAPTQTALIATATQLPDIVARATGNGQEDSIVVQLDPPELGRVSIDFKFDAQGLQHVTITAENPEAMRQLRQMHFELVQALERNGLSSQNMSFQHQNPQQNEGWGQQTKFSNVKFDSAALSGGGLVIAADNNPHRQIASGGRLDLRL